MYNNNNNDDDNNNNNDNHAEVELFCFKAGAVKLA